MGWFEQFCLYSYHSCLHFVLGWQTIHHFSFWSWNITIKSCPICTKKSSALHSSKSLCFVLMSCFTSICEYIYECTSDPMFGLLLDRFRLIKDLVRSGLHLKFPKLIGHTSLQKPRISARIKRWRKFGEILQPFLEWANQEAWHIAIFYNSTRTSLLCK